MTPWAVAYAHRDTDLRKMRHLDLLALWHELHPDNHHGNQHCAAARLSKESLAAAILNSPA